MVLLNLRHETSLRYYKDVDALGLFADCQDLDRLLSMIDDIKVYYNLLTYIFTARGIPILYYGSEQGFKGAQDPLNREPLFGQLNKDHELYRFIKMLNKLRRGCSLNEYPLEELYTSQHLYSFRRGQLIVALTNKASGQWSTIVSVPSLPKHTSICNLMNRSDCQEVVEGQVRIQIDDGQPKLYLPVDHPYFALDR